MLGERSEVFQRGETRLLNSLLRRGKEAPQCGEFSTQAERAPAQPRHAERPPQVYGDYRPEREKQRHAFHPLRAGKFKQGSKRSRGEQLLRRELLRKLCLLVLQFL